MARRRKRRSKRFLKSKGFDGQFYDLLQHERKNYWAELKPYQRAFWGMFYSPARYNELMKETEDEPQ